MELTNEFTVPVPLDRAWEVLNDVELIAPCMPGAQLEEIEGDEYRGTVKVKVGPITAQYKGAAIFTERDRSSGKLVIKAEGRDTRGQGSASALITVTMTETAGSTDVQVLSDVTIKGKVAQFGRGMIADVSAKLLTQFVECLEGKLEAPAAAAVVADQQPEVEPRPAEVADAAPAAPSVTTAPVAPEAPAATEPAAAEPVPAATAPTGVRKVNQPAAEPVDLLETAGAPVAKRIIPVVVAVLVLLVLGKARSRKRRQRRAG